MDKTNANGAIAMLGRRIFGVGPPLESDARESTNGLHSADYAYSVRDLVDIESPLPIGSRINGRLFIYWPPNGLRIKLSYVGTIF